MGVRELIGAFLSADVPDMVTLDAGIRLELAALDLEAIASALRQGVAEADRRRGSARRGPAQGVLARHLAETAVARGDYPGAASYFHLASRELLAKLEGRHRARFLLDQAWVTHCLGDYASALALCGEAFPALGPAPDPDTLALAYSTRGIAHYRLGHLAEALDDHGKALGLRETSNDLSGQAASFNYLGNVYLERGDWANAERCFLDSLARYRHLDRPDRIAALEYNLGNLAALRGEFEAAERHHRCALDLRSKAGDRYGCGASRCALASAWLRAGRTSEARRGFERGLRLLEVSGAGELKVEALLGQSLAVLVEGDRSEARRVAGQALELATRQRDRVQLGAAHVLLARIERLSGDRAAAGREVAIALDLLGHTGSRYQMAKARLESAHVHLANRDAGEARNQLRIALSELEDLGALPDLVGARSLEKRLDDRRGPAVQKRTRVKR